jgi:hypothetical protein
LFSVLPTLIFSAASAQYGVKNYSEAGSSGLSLKSWLLWIQRSGGLQFQIRLDKKLGLVTQACHPSRRHKQGDHSPRRPGDKSKTLSGKTEQTKTKEKGLGAISSGIAPT